jgi:voltage-gated potassium channel
VAVLRAVLTASVLVAMYYLLPMNFGGSNVSTVVKLALGLVVFVALMTWQARAIANDDTPGLRALEGLFLALPLFLLLFASAYYLMSQADDASFTSPLTRTDALYFTVTIFSTVGFGDISGQSQTARLVVIAQMMLDLVILGVGARIILSAVTRGRERLSESSVSGGGDGT